MKRRCKNNGWVQRRTGSGQRQRGAKAAFRIFPKLTVRRLCPTRFRPAGCGVLHEQRGGRCVVLSLGLDELVVGQRILQVDRRNTLAHDRKSVHPSCYFPPRGTIESKFASFRCFVATGLRPLVLPCAFARRVGRCWRAGSGGSGARTWPFSLVAVRRCWRASVDWAL